MALDFLSGSCSMGLAVDIQSRLTQLKEEIEMSDFIKYLNADVDMSVAQQSLSLNLAEAVLSGAVTKDNFKEYLKSYQSAMTAQGRNEDSVKVMKSQRKFIFDFAFGLRKEQKDNPEFWTADANARILEQEAANAGSLSLLIKALKSILNDEKDDAPKAFDFAAELAKLVEKAEAEGMKPNAIKSALNATAKAI